MALKLNLEELKAALAELEARGNPGEPINIVIEDHKVILSCNDRTQNIMEAILYDNATLGAQFRMTNRLMFMKDKKRI